MCLVLLCPGWAAAQDCRLALLLALDTSSSVDDEEYAMQRDGLGRALLDPQVQAAILERGGAVSLAAFEWSGRRQVSVILDWTTLDGPADIQAASARLRQADRRFRSYPTAMGFALDFGAQMLARGPQCDRQVIDVSADGVTNDGHPPFQSYLNKAFDRITVNGLAVLGEDPLIADHFEFEVLHGPGAFLIKSDGFTGFEEAMTRKLVREIRQRVVGHKDTPAKDMIPSGADGLEIEQLGNG
ncbi:MAG: DUF1194 domain-containing protein [Pelagimonas sp.]|nr:DUF1194 domain-containing protein [Pelagimonas sp.]